MNKKTNYFLFLIFFNIILIISSICFLTFKEVDSIIINQGESVSDLSRYYSAYINKNLNQILSENFDSISFYLTATFLNFIGFSFIIFLFIITYLYYLIFSILFYKVTLSQNILLYICLFAILSFWMSPLILVVLSQGFALIILFYFIFLKAEKFIYNFKYTFLILILSTFHSSILIFLPYLFFEKYFLSRIKFLEIISFIIFIGYIFESFYFFGRFFLYLSELMSINVGALSNKGNTYAVGFSIKKALMIFFPIFFYRFYLLKNFHRNTFIQKRIYIFVIYVSLIGMLLSGLPYYDRIFLYSWVMSPILISSFIFKNLRNRHKYQY